MAILTATKIKYTTLYKMAIQAFRGEVIGSGVFRMAIKTV